MKDDFEHVEHGQLVPGTHSCNLATEASSILETYYNPNKAQKGEDSCNELMFAPIVGAMLPEKSTAAPPGDTKRVPKHNEAANDVSPKPESKESKPPEKLKTREVEIDGIRKLSYQQAMQEADAVVYFEKAPPGLRFGGQSASGSVGAPRERDGAPSGQKALQGKPEPLFVPSDGAPRGQKALQETPSFKPERKR